MQNNSRVYLGDEDSAERNNVRLKRASEVSLGSARMLWTEMEQLKESSGEELETYKQKTKKLLQEMDRLIASTEREKDLMTNELHTSTEVRKQLAEIRNGIRVSTETEKELLTKELKSSRETVKQFSQEINELRETEKELLTKELKSSRETVKQFSQEINELREAEKGLLTKELKSSREAVEQLSQEINELRASTDREKELLNTSKEALKQLSEMMNELRVSAEREKELLTKELKSSREAAKQLSQEMNELREAFIETEKGRLTKELKLFRETVTQLSQEINEERASRGREKELPKNELKTSRKGRRNFSQDKSEFRASGKRQTEKYGNVKGMEKLKVSSSNECDEPVASRSTIFRKFQGFFGSSKSTRQGRRLFRKTQKEHKVNTEASPGMQLSAGPSHEHHLEYVQEHDKITDSPEISGSDEVESGSTASSGRCKAGPSLVKNIDSGKRHDKVMDSQKGLKSDGEKQSRGMGPTSRSVDNYVRQNQSDGALQQISGRIATRGAYHGTDDDYTNFYKQERTRIYHDPSPCTGRITTREAYHGTDDDYIHFCRQERTRIYHDPSPCTGMGPTNRSVDNYVRQNQSDGALQQTAGRITTRGAYHGTDDDHIHICRQERTRIYHDPSPCTGMVSTSRSVDNYVRQNQSDGALPQISGQLLPFRSAESPSSLQHEIDITDLPNSGIKIEQQPKSKKQPEGSEVIFELKVQEQDRYSYQWLKDGAELEGKCDAILILDNVELHQFGWYICRVRSRENFRINCESSRAWLDVVPKVQKGTRLKKFIDVDLSTCDKIAFYLDKDVPFGLGGNRQAADVFGMTKDMIGALATSKSPGQVIVEFVKATKPDITVYEVFKQLKGDEMNRFDIAKILENHLTITESEV